jgi:hypothetical protein
VPKTVVATTGPVYVAEVVPLLAMLTAGGAFALARRLDALGLGRGRERVGALVAAAFAVALALFLPAQLVSMHRSGAAWQTANRMLDRAGAENAVVFADRLVDLRQANTWAYYPPNPSPRLDDARIFVRLPGGAERLPLAVEFWRRRFPERSAWVYGFEEGHPFLRRLRAPESGSTPVSVR